MGSPARPPERAGVDEAFRQWIDAYVDEHGEPYAQGFEMSDSFRAGWEIALKMRAAQFGRDREEIDREEKDEKLSDMVVKHTFWCGKFYTIPPGTLHDKDSCYK